MAAHLLKRLGTSLAVPALVIGTFALAVPPGTTASTVDQGRVELAALSSNAVFHEMTWDVDAGQQGYSNFIKQLRQLMVLATTGHRGTYGTGRQTATVDTLNNRATNIFADIDVQTAGAAIHLVVRLSDLYVVGFHTQVNPSEWRGFDHVYIPIADDFPELTTGLVGGDYTTDTDWVGRENYNTLARLANTRLTDVTVGEYSLQDAIHALRNPHLSNTPNIARGLLRLIMAVSEATRFRTIATGVTTHFSGSQYRISNTNVSMIRNWQGLSSVFHHYADPNAAGSSSRSVDIPGYGVVDNLQAAVRLLMVALASGDNPNTKDEL